MAPLFSVIIPTYNRVGLISRAIDSVLDQTFEDWEVVIIDDGSTDDTNRLIAKFANARIRYFYQGNSGKSAARNRGINEAQGDFICFLDSDDYYLPGHLHILYREIKKRDFLPAVYRTGMISEGGKKEDKSVFYDSSHDVHPILFFARYMVGTNTICVHKSAFHQHLFDERFHYFQDTHLLLRVLSEFPFFQIPAYTCIYRIHAGRSSYTLYDQENVHDLVENNVDAIKDLFDNYQGLIGSHLDGKLRNYLISKKYMDHAAEALVAGKVRLSFRYFRNAIRHDKGRWQTARYLKYLPKIPTKILFDYPKNRK